MGVKSLVYNSVTVSLPKNVVQFLLGAVLFWLVQGAMDFSMGVLALAAFLITYSSVYFFNDIVDCEDDKQDSEKMEWKLVAKGKMSKRVAGIAGTVFLLAGLSLSSMVNGWFTLIMIALISLNFLHSSPYVRLKKRTSATAVNITAIEFLKYSCGWFAFTSNLSTFPFWLIMCFSLIYSAVYLVYKFKFKGSVIMANKSVVVPLGLGAAFSYFVSIFLYDFALPMLILLAASLIMTSFSRGKRLRFMNWLWVEFAILPIIVIAFLLLSVPSIAQANDNISGRIEQYKYDIYHQLPTGVAKEIKNLTESRYESLEEWQDSINLSVNLSAIEFLKSLESEKNK